jgi:uncharacterized protein (DUF2141 family)
MVMKFTSSATLPLVFALTSCSTVPHEAREPVGPAASGSGTLVIEIEGLRTAAGQVNVSLFGGPDGFPQDTSAVVESETVQLTGTRALVVRFENLRYGDYAIAILHDENGNGVMDTGFLGIPSEGFGFSNNPRTGFGAPSFETCKFRLDRPEVALQLQIRYL